MRSRRGWMLDLALPLAIVLGAAIGILSSCVHVRAADCTLWAWSAPAAHHQAVCLVRATSGASTSSGSGCYVRIGDVLGVLTARHCLDGRVSIRWSDGSTTAGEPTTDRTGADLGFIVATHATIEPLEISSAEPRPGEWLEFLGFGGPDDQLRHWWGRLSDVSSRDEGGNAFADYACAVMQGDSGGPVLNQYRQVVGVITCGAGNPIASLGSAQTFASTGGPAYTTVAAFATRVGQRYGGLFIGGVRGGSCGPSGCGPQPGGDGNWAYPPQPAPVPAQPQQPPPPLVPIPAPSPAPVPTPAPAQPTGPQPQFSASVDYDRLARVLLEYCAADPRFRGPAGPQGEQGNPGPPAMLSAEETQRIVNTLYAAMLADTRFRGAGGEISAAQIEALYQRLLADPALRGQPGPPGPPGRDGSAGTSPAVDIEQLAAAVAPKLPPIYFRKVNAATGAELSPPEPVRLGEGFTFLLTPGVSK